MIDEGAAKMTNAELLAWADRYLATLKDQAFEIFEEADLIRQLAAALKEAEAPFADRGVRNDEALP